MKQKAVWIFLIIFFVVCMSYGYTQAKPDLNTIINTIDRLYRADSSYVRMEMEINTPHWSRTLEMKAWTKGMDKMLIRILQPLKERGMGTLRKGNQMWNYLPKTDKIMQVPPSMMMSSWMGSDFNNNDLVKEFTFTDDYRLEYTTIDSPASGMYYLKGTPKPGKPIVWGYVIVAVDSETYIPKWQKFYDEHGDLKRTMRYREIKTFDNRTVPSVIELIPQDKEGHKTVLRYLEAEFNQNIRDRIFTRSNLRSFRG